MKPTNLAAPAAARLLAAALLAASASPALAVTPFKMRVPIGPIVAAAPVPDILVAGYDPLADVFQSTVGSFTWDGTSYTVPSGTAFGFAGPVTLTLAMTGTDVKTAMRNNPTALSPAAATWLSAGVPALAWDPNVGQWHADPPDTLYCLGGTFDFVNWLCDGAKPPLPAKNDVCQRVGPAYVAGFDAWGQDVCKHYATGSQIGSIAARIRVDPPVPATSDDWDALPDPLNPLARPPGVGGELPYAPYMPAGVAIQNNFTITDLNTGTVHHCTNGGCD